MKNHSRNSLTLKDVGSPQHLAQAIDQMPLLCSQKLSTQNSVDMFFKLIDKIGIDQHSGFRYDFWQEYLKRNMIHQAWIILAPKAMAVAQKDLGLQFFQCAHLHKTRRVDSNHAVLLMRVGALIVAEWSHIGKCRFWRAKNNNAPAFFKRKYTRADLIDGADYVQQHYFSVKGLWQKDARLFIEAQR